MFIQLKKDYFGQQAGARIDVEPPVAETLLAQGIAEAVQGDPLAPIVARSMETLLVNLIRRMDRSRFATFSAVFLPGFRPARRLPGRWGRSHCRRGAPLAPDRSP